MSYTSGQAKFTPGRHFALKGGIAATATLSGNVTLDLSSAQILSYDCNGAHRDVTLPAEELGEMAYWITNQTANTYNVVVKNDAGGTVQTIGPTRSALIVCTGSAWVAHLIPVDISGTMTLSGLLTTSAGIDNDSTYDQDVALTGTGDAANIAATISHATQVAEGLDVSIAQITNVRTAGTVTGIKSKVTSLSGDTAGVDYYAFEAAVTAGEAGADHIVLKVGAGFDAALDLSSCATGEGDIILADNLALALQVREGSTAYLDFVTTNDAERINVQKIMAFPAVTVVDMANAAHALVLDTADSGETKLVGNIVAVDANGGAQDLTLPAEASCDGFVLIIANTGGEAVTVKDDAAGTVIVLDDSTQHGLIWCDGTTWRGLIGAAT